MPLPKRYAQYSALPEINIIPLIDVLLVLVAVLLLLTPFMAKSIGVDLPDSVSGAAMTQDTSVVIEIRSDGVALYEGKPISDWKTLYAQMRSATTAKIFADKATAFAAVTRVMDQLARNDIHNIQFAVRD